MKSFTDRLTFQDTTPYLDGKHMHYYDNSSRFIYLDSADSVVVKVEPFRSTDQDGINQCVAEYVLSQKASSLGLDNILNPTYECGVVKRAGKKRFPYFSWSVQPFVPTRVGKPSDISEPIARLTEVLGHAQDANFHDQYRVDDEGKLVLVDYGMLTDYWGKSDKARKLHESIVSKTWRMARKAEQ